MEEIRVVDNPERSRYEALVGERILGVVEYKLRADSGRIVLVHTEVQPDAEGMGVGSRLAKGALDDVRRRGLKLRVECDFINSWLKRHRGDYEDLLGRP
jgi:uncharacterized protein